MPDVLSIGGFKVMMFEHDKPPPYVHIRSSGGWAFVTLGEDEESVAGLKWFGMEDWEVRRAEMVIRTLRMRFIRKWEELHAAQH